MAMSFGMAMCALTYVGCAGTMQPTPTPTASPSPTPSPTPTASPAPESQLFIANNAGNRVTTYINPSTINGNIQPSTNISGDQTQISAPQDLAVTATGALLVLSGSTQSIVSYDSAATVNGNQSPERNVSGAATQLDSAVTMALDVARDLLYVANTTGNILQFENASQPAFNGNIAPPRVISSPDVDNPRGVNLGPNGDLYVLNAGTFNVAAFSQPQTRNGVVPANRIIQSADFAAADLFDAYVDADDNLYVVNSVGFIYIFRNASNLNGTVDPDLTIFLPPATSITSIVVDESGAAYISDQADSAIFVLENVANLNGTRNADRTIFGSTTQMANPIRIFLNE